MHIILQTLRDAILHHYGSSWWVKLDHFALYFWTEITEKNVMYNVVNSSEKQNLIMCCLLIQSKRLHNNYQAKLWIMWLLRICYDSPNVWWRHQWLPTVPYLPLGPMCDWDCTNELCVMFIMFVEEFMDTNVLRLFNITQRPWCSSSAKDGQL